MARNSPGRSLILSRTYFQPVHHIFGSDIPFYPHFTEEIDGLNERQIEQVGGFPEGKLPSLVSFRRKEKENLKRGQRAGRAAYEQIMTDGYSKQL
jgi:hypothetical protein